MYVLNFAESFVFTLKLFEIQMSYSFQCMHDLFLKRFVTYQTDYNEFYLVVDLYCLRDGYIVKLCNHYIAKSNLHYANINIKNNTEYIVIIILVLVLFLVGEHQCLLFLRILLFETFKFLNYHTCVEYSMNVLLC